MLTATVNGNQSQPSISSSTIESSQPCRHFKFDEILLATDNFDESLVIGHGGFGKVYKGNITNGSSVIVAAIKRLDSMSSQGASEFWAEVEMLSKLRYCHLVSLLGYCNHGEEMILVYEYMPNGTLADHLHKLGTPLSWVQRLKICIGAARALDYLHTGTGIDVGITHRDVKTSNILLHESWASRISDFGLSKIGPTNQPSTYVNTLVKGTFGYLDPDYTFTGRLTRKSDVYALGVVLLEVLCRKPALDRSLDIEQQNLARWAQESIKEGNLKHIIDSGIKGEISPKCLKKYVQIAQSCLHSIPKQRPTMGEVVFTLESILTQEKANSSFQPADRTIFGRMLDIFLFPSKRINHDIRLDNNPNQHPTMADVEIGLDYVVTLQEKVKIENSDSASLPIPIAVAIEGMENDQVVAKVISLAKETIGIENETALTPSLVALVEKNQSKGINSVLELEYNPLWGFQFICGKRPEMEDSVAAVPRLLEIPIKMFVGNHVIDGMSSNLTDLTSHFFGVYDGHGGSQVADYCSDRIHLALEEELKLAAQETVNDTLQVQWEKVFTNCFQKVDDEVGGRISRRTPEMESQISKPVAPETVGSTAVVAVVCSSHIIIANCGDSRAVLYRGKEVIALSNDHKPNREDEYARIEAAGGKVIQWNGHRVFGVLATSRSIGDGYLKPWIIPKPEVTFTARAREDECLILASDGLWDVMSNEEVCEIARQRILIWHTKNGGYATDRGTHAGHNPAARAAADYLAMLALQKGSKDNISIIVVDLKPQKVQDKILIASVIS